MKCGWQTHKFGDICELKKGKKPTLSSAQTSGLKPYLVAKYLRGSEPTEFAPESDKNAVPVKKHEIIIICDGSNSGETFIGFDGVLSSTMAKIAHGPDLDNKFLMYFLDSLFEKFNASKTGAAIPHLDLFALREQTLPVPPLAEQQRIVGILEEAFDGITTAEVNAEKNVLNARALFESHLQSVFEINRGCVSLSELATDVTDGDHSPPPKAPSGVPFITISDIVKRTRAIDFSNTFYVPPEYFQNLKPNKKPKRGDVLYTVTGATLGIPVLVKDDIDFCFQRHIGLIRPRPDTDSVWLSYALLSPQVYRQATVGSTGTAQKTVSLAVLRSIVVPRISLTEQRATAAKLDSFSAETQRLESVYQQKLAALDALKKSLLHQAFTGEL